jgi:hypothetical protein
VKRLLAILFLISALGLGCSTSTVFVRALEPPKWPVAPGRTIGVVAVLENKRGSNAHLTRDLTAIVADRLKQSAYYTRVESHEITAGDFKIGKTGERLPLEETITACARELGVDLLLFVEALDSKVWFSLGGRVSYGMGIGRAYGRTGMGVGFSTATSYWDAHARMLLCVTLAGAGDKAILASTVEGHSFHRSYGDTLPSESHVFGQLLKWANSRTLTYIDVYYHLAPRRLRYDGTKLVSDGVGYALAGGRRNWETARHFWNNARTQNPSSLAATYNLGVAAEIREDYAAAVSHYKTARKLAGVENAFARELEQASHSVEVLATFGAPAETEEKTEEKTAPEPPEATQLK